MATEVTLPKLGMNTEQAIIVNWRKQEGDRVAVGDVLADVETEKATIELEAEAAGVLRKLLVTAGEQVSVHQPIAIVGTADEDISELELTVATRQTTEHAHVSTIYQSWKRQPAVPNGGRSASSMATVTASNGANGNGDGRLNADAIRARLAAREVLNSVEPATARTRLIIYGSGLGAKQVLEVTRHHEDISVVGLIDDNPELQGAVLGGVRVLGGFEALAGLVATQQIDGVVLSFHSQVRKKVHERIKRELGIRIHPLVDPRAMVGMDVTIEDGALVEAGAVIGPGTTIGEGTIVDVGVTVAHDCFLGAFSHLSPGCSLSGVVCLTENVLVGVGAALNSTITIGRNVIITPGAAVMNDLPDDVIVAGVPAKVIGASRRGA